MQTRHSRFRFPVAAITFMSLAFLGIIMAITMASRAAQTLTRSTSFEKAFAGYPWFLFQPFVILFAVTAVIAVVIWATLFAQHRAGVHRLQDAETWPRQH